jgi:hypothetical protein
MRLPKLDSSWGRGNPRHHHPRPTTSSGSPPPTPSKADRGAAIIEMAIVFPLLIVLLVGTITAGMAYGRSNSVQNASREASRFAATLPGPIDTAWLQTVRDVARSAAIGDLAPTVPGQFICVAYVDGVSNTRLTDTGGVEATANTPCFNDGRPANEARIQVVTSRLARIEAVFFGFDVTLRSEAAARYERQE